jgi:hypothetical protein
MVIVLAAYDLNVGVGGSSVVLENIGWKWLRIAVPPPICRK